MTTRRLLPIALLFLLVAACGKDSKGGGGPAPAEPQTGAPVAFEVVKVRAPDTLDVRVYNFSDKTFATYAILLRYYDKDGKVLIVKPGTPFEKDHDFWSMSGRGFISKPKQWTSFELDHLELPEGTAKAEILASSVTAVKADGMTMDEEPTWRLEHSMDWPTAPATK